MSAWTAPTFAEEGALLDATRSVAVVGISDNPERPSYEIADYLLRASAYDVYLVNPTLTEVLGRAVFPTLASLPVVPDLVDVFRRPAELGAVADQAIAVGAKVLWLQLGLSDEAAAERAVAAGMDVVMDRCLMVEHARWTASRPR